MCHGHGVLDLGWVSLITQCMYHIGCLPHHLGVTNALSSSPRLSHFQTHLSKQTLGEIRTQLLPFASSTSAFFILRMTTKSQKDVEIHHLHASFWISSPISSTLFPSFIPKKIGALAYEFVFILTRVEGQ